MADRACHAAFVALGSNLDDPVAQVRAACDGLSRLPRTRVTQTSSLYRSAPVGYADQPDFVNAVARLATGLAPHALLQALLALEARQGRVRTIPNGPRTLDLDLLLYDDRCIDEKDLVIPHPRLHTRAFVLLPLREIAPDLVVPGRGPVSALLASLDPGGVERLSTAAR